MAFFMPTKCGKIHSLLSSIVINEHNYIINVNHPDFSKLKIIDTEDYLFDTRLIDKMK